MAAQRDDSRRGSGMRVSGMGGCVSGSLRVGHRSRPESQTVGRARHGAARVSGRNRQDAGTWRESEGFNQDGESQAGSDFLPQHGLAGAASRPRSTSGVRGGARVLSHSSPPTRRG